MLANNNCVANIVQPYPEVAEMKKWRGTILLLILLMVSVIDAGSAWLRKRLA